MATEQDQARSIAERVARRVAGGEPRSSVGGSPVPAASGAPVRDELTAIRTGLHDLERKLESIESKIVDGTAAGSAESTRARMINFVSSGAPLATPPSVGVAPPAPTAMASTAFTPATHSPWIRDFDHAVDHPSQERFGIDEATVAELVEFFENEKKCSVEPGGKPCDHCSMCSSRGF